MKKERRGGGDGGGTTKQAIPTVCTATPCSLHALHIVLQSLRHDRQIGFIKVKKRIEVVEDRLDRPRVCRSVVILRDRLLNIVVFHRKLADVAAVGEIVHGVDGRAGVVLNGERLFVHGR